MPRGHGKGKSMSYRFPYLEMIEEGGRSIRAKIQFRSTVRRRLTVLSLFRVCWCNSFVLGSGLGRVRRRAHVDFCSFAECFLFANGEKENSRRLSRVAAKTRMAQHTHAHLIPGNSLGGKKICGRRFWKVVKQVFSNWPVKKSAVCLPRKITFSPFGNLYRYRTEKKAEKDLDLYGY